MMLVAACWPRPSASPRRPRIRAQKSAPQGSTAADSNKPDTFRCPLHVAPQSTRTTVPPFGGNGSAEKGVRYNCSYVLMPDTACCMLTTSLLLGDQNIITTQLQFSVAGLCVLHAYHIATATDATAVTTLRVRVAASARAAVAPWSHNRFGHEIIHRVVRTHCTATLAMYTAHPVFPWDGTASRSSMT